MSWALFCQIEVILMTAGLVVSFVLLIGQRTKDHSFYIRLKTIAEALGAVGKTLSKKKENEQHDA